MDLFIQDIIDILQEFAPVELAESWDNVGLLVGNRNAQADSLIVALDPTSALLDEAEIRGANVIITHHPAIFHPLKALRTDQPLGHFLAEALKKNIHIIACHTNLDSAVGGVSDILATRLNLMDLSPLVPENTGESSTCGLGRIGRCAQPMTPEGCIEKLRNATNAPWLLEAGIRPNQVNKIAVCGGSCSEFAETAMQAGADLYITAEVKHSTARWAEEAGFWIIDGGHFATEHLAIAPLRERLQEEIKKRDMNNQVSAVLQNPPLTLV
jgi:dinuclear metal center YbgI/SA1388 family protein